jgi:hypothetical protein
VNAVFLNVCELLERPTIFIGEVIAAGITYIQEDPWRSSATFVRFQVLEILRGLPAGTQIVELQLAKAGPGMCASVPYYQGRKYLVVPSRWNGQLTDGVCFQGRDVETFADQVRQVRDYFCGVMPIHVQDVHRGDRC